MSNSSLNAIRDLALKDLDATPSAELHAEVLHDGDDPETLARLVAEHLDSVVADFIRQRDAVAKSSVNVGRRVATHRPAIDRIKQLIELAFRHDPNLATAFRDGTAQSQEDLQSLYDDLVDLGKIAPEDSGA